MKSIWLILLIFSNTNILQNNSPVSQKFIGELLVFKMKYLNLSVATLNFENIDTTQKYYNLKVYARSTQSASLLFKLDNVYETYFDTSNFLPTKAVKKIRQKNIQHELIINYHHQQNIAFINDSVKWSIPGDCFDYFSMLYFLRTRELNPGDTIHFHLDSEYLISKVKAVVLPDQEVIRVPAGEFNSIKAKLKITALTHEPRPWKTDLLTNRLAAPGSELLIWFSDDPYRLPLKISYQRSTIKTEIVLKSFERGDLN